MNDLPCLYLYQPGTSLENEARVLKVERSSLIISLNFKRIIDNDLALRRVFPSYAAGLWVDVQKDLIEISAINMRQTKVTVDGFIPVSHLIKVKFTASTDFTLEIGKLKFAAKVELPTEEKQILAVPRSERFARFFRIVLSRLTASR